MARAQRVTVRRLEDDVDHALGGGPLDPAQLPLLPPIELRPPGVQTGERTRWRWDRHPVRFNAPCDLARLFRATLASVQRTLERTSGHASSPAAALEAMIDHAEAVWWVEAGRDPYDRRILERDGWRCAMPGCSSYGGLHVHHVIYRSHGGPEVPHNEVTLCVWHHQRGQHGGLLRVTGQAPDRLRFEMPLETFRSGDLRVSPQP